MSMRSKKSYRTRGGQLNVISTVRYHDVWTMTARKIYTFFLKKECWEDTTPLLWMIVIVIIIFGGSR